MNEDPAMTDIYRWMWKSNPDPWLENTEEEWEEFADVEMSIIEDAYQKKLTSAELNHHTIDLLRLLQISKTDKMKQRPIKRVFDSNVQRIRKERFFLASQDVSHTHSKSFGEEGRWISPTFIQEWNRRNPRVSLTSRVEKAAQGILIEGQLHDQKCESEYLARCLLDVKEKSWNEVALQSVYLYTRETFLYKALNKALREDDLSKVDTLGPLCDFIWNSLSSEYLKSKFRFKGLVYRSASLKPDEIDAYKHSVKKNPKEWLGFSSASKNRHVAEIYDGNTLFIINLSSQSQHLDISTLSQFPNEEEVLLGASSSFRIENVKQDEASGKYHINLTILW